MIMTKNLPLEKKHLVKNNIQMCPQVAAACSGVHSSLSRAFTLAPKSINNFIIGSLSSMQHCKTETDVLRFITY